MFLAMTPEGVEHSIQATCQLRLQPVFLAMTPEGVEHEPDIVGDAPRVCVSRNDAGRR